MSAPGAFNGPAMGILNAQQQLAGAQQAGLAAAVVQQRLAAMGAAGAGLGGVDLLGYNAAALGAYGGAGAFGLAGGPAAPGGHAARMALLEQLEKERNAADMMNKQQQPQHGQN